MSVFIIAEIGVNHNGSIRIAKKLIDSGVEAGVDAVKFQTFSADLSISKHTKKAEYQKKETDEEETQYDMVKKLEFTYDEFRELKKYCDKKNIIFMSTPDEVESSYFLKDLQDIFKIGSGEVNNLPLLRYIGGLDKNIILSSGMSTMQEIEDAFNILVSSGTKKNKITILHANTEYPTPMEDVNLKAMLSIGNKFGVDYGFSDHTMGIEASVAAVALGSSVIEKHFTLDRNMVGPDHQASIEPAELKVMVKSIRNIEIALGDGIKKPTKSELKNINVCRKSIVARKPIKKGQIITETDITVKKPGNGLSPMMWDDVIDKIAKKDYCYDEFIQL